MPESFDVVVVGARCAGAPLAMLLARAGLKVCLLDRSRFPSEVPSTHAIQPNGVAALRRFGVLDRIAATGAPPIGEARIDIDGVVVDYCGPSAFIEKTDAPMFCIRRSTFDPILIDAAVEAGADFRPETTVTGVVSNGKVDGVQTASGTISASLVVGADGPNSTVARMVASREYHSTPPGRLFMWGYFEGVEEDPPCLRLGKTADIAMLAAPTDAGLYLVAVVPSQQDKARYLSNTATGFHDGVSCFPDVAALVASAPRVGPVRTMARWHGFFREACGPGWVLVGDAGHFKDPTPGQGIADAFRQVELLAPAIVDGLAGGSLDRRLQEWARWRDEDAWEMYWFASDIGAPGPTSPLVREMIRHIVSTRSGADRFLQVLNHDLAPSKLFTPFRAFSAAFNLAGTRKAPARVAAKELRQVIGREVTRRRQQRRPRYAAISPLWNNSQRTPESDQTKSDEAAGPC